MFSLCQPKITLHYNLCGNISEQFTIISRKCSLKSAHWKRNSIKNFAELSQHERYEILHQEVEVKHFYFPHFLMVVLLCILREKHSVTNKGSEDTAIALS